MALEVVSFFSACTALNIALVYSIELFPTCVRNSAISLVRQALVLGGVFAPILVVEGRKKSFMSFGVFGLAIYRLLRAVCGLFAGDQGEEHRRHNGGRRGQGDFLLQLPISNLIKALLYSSSTVSLSLLSIRDEMVFQKSRDKSHLAQKQ